MNSNANLPNRLGGSKILPLVIGSLVLGHLSMTAKAATVTLGGVFAVQFPPAGPAYQGTSEFSGEWTLSFEEPDASFVGSLEGVITGLTFWTVDHNFVGATGITIGATNFDAEALNATVVYDSGSLVRFDLSGGEFFSNHDYFSLRYVSYVQNGRTLEECNDCLFEVVLSSSTQPFFNRVTAFDQSQGFIDDGFSGFWTIPEPGIGLLSMLFGVFALRRRRSS